VDGWMATDAEARCVVRAGLYTRPAGRAWVCWLTGTHGGAGCTPHGAEVKPARSTWLGAGLGLGLGLGTGLRVRVRVRDGARARARGSGLGARGSGFGVRGSGFGVRGSGRSAAHLDAEGRLIGPLARVVGADRLGELKEAVHVLLAPADAAAVGVAVEAYDEDVTRAVGDRGAAHLEGAQRGLRRAKVSRELDADARSRRGGRRAVAQLADELRAAVGRVAQGARVREIDARPTEAWRRAIARAVEDRHNEDGVVDPLSRVVTACLGVGVGEGRG
jgi:hypothetical protein